MARVVRWASSSSVDVSFGGPCDTAATRVESDGRASAVGQLRGEAIVHDTRPHDRSRRKLAELELDDEVMASTGKTDLSEYSVTPGAQLMPDFFV